MMPPGVSLLLSNQTARTSRIPGINKIVYVGGQRFIKKWLIENFNEHFFERPWSQVVAEAERHIKIPNFDHFEHLHSLGHLPLEIRTLPEGTLVPMGVPYLISFNTHPDFAWLPNYLESLSSAEIWPAINSATLALEYRKQFDKAAEITGIDPEFVPWQGHDFSFRGMGGAYHSIISGIGHLTSFYGTDTIPAIYEIEKYYGCDGIIGGSVPATEHMIQCLYYDYKTGDESSYVKAILDAYPSGIVSMVSDGMDYWRMLTEEAPKFKDRIMSRDGKLVFRPDSGNPVEIICGTGKPASLEEMKGSMSILMDIYGSTTNEKGYKVLDPHVGLIYGDAITPLRQRQILATLIRKGIQPNLVLGIGSMTYMGGDKDVPYWVSRDLFGIAQKATFAIIDGTPKDLFKAPKTDRGIKRSMKGIPYVTEDLTLVEEYSDLKDTGMLQPVFINGKMFYETNWNDIRSKIRQQIHEN